MTIEAHAFATGTLADPATATADLFALGRRATATRDARLGARGSFVRSRAWTPTGWQGPRDAAESTIEEAQLAAAGGLDGARAAGVDVVVGGRDTTLPARAAAAGLRVLWRISYRNGDSGAEREQRIGAVAALAPALWGVMPAPEGEPYGLDTLRMFALVRLALPGAVHLLADVGALGPRLAQMAFGFGADEIFAPIVAERALRLGANAHNPALTRKEAATLLRGAGVTACERAGDGTLSEVAS